jgi:ubiquinone/menaquinone biosynthesis C-methylase UbiE
MNAADILLNAFGRPKGILGRLGGVIMARMNRPCAVWVIELLDVQADDTILEVGFGPGRGIELLVEAASAGHIAGVDPSPEMIEQATARNAKAVQNGRVELRRGSAESLPFPDGMFDKALAINSMQVWPDPVAGLREMRRVTKRGGRIALAFTPYAGQSKSGLAETLAAAGLSNAEIVESDKGFCALATIGSV